MKSIKNLLLDLDGTLVNLDEIKAKLYFVSKAILWKEFNTSPIRILYSFLTFKERIISNPNEVLIYQKAINGFSESMNISITKSEKLLNNFLEVTFPLLKKYFTLIPEANNFINWAKNKYTLFLATNPFWPPEYVSLRLQWAGIDVNAFKFISHSKNMNYSKHSKKYFQDLLSRNKLNSQECLMIGNKLSLDGNAREVGMNVFIVNLEKKKKKFLGRNPLKNFESKPINFGQYSNLIEYLERNSKCLL
ncbi:HAD family hydrolase [Pigmentibacter sp. JX0631]|uniref:HAD family hydrolase n=1 Tax=Pigmentibacter sp. JX0631 TaxID=2976982 RepID=UPI002468CE55|nr:HAD family hydrolase [Pigmentibacter sp. JX0631]WGL60602.1 HAD family hydrolase [Pigmentibacter sp. JX0631]